MGPDRAAWVVPGVNHQNPFPPSAQLLDEAETIFGAFLTSAGGLPTGAQLLHMRRTLDQLEGLWLATSADFSQSGALADTGHPSLTSWMRDHCRMAPAEAKARAKVAEAITTTQPATGTAIREGKLTWRHADVIESALRQVPIDRRAEAEESLVREATNLDPGQLRRVGDRLIHCFDRDHADQIAIRRLGRRCLNVSETYEGMVSVNGLLDPISGSLLLTALNTINRPTPVGHEHGDGHSTGHSDAALPAADFRTPTQRRADAIAEICSQWLGNINTATVGGVRPHLSVIVDHATLAARPTEPPARHPGLGTCLGTGPGTGVEPAQLAWIGPITATEAQLIGCDSTISRIVLDGPSQVIDVGRATRTIPPALRRAVAARDRTCIGPGCHRPPEHCDVHHIVFWEHGGDTSPKNTVLLCRHHHRLVHLQHWRITEDTTGRRTLDPP